MTRYDDNVAAFADPRHVLGPRSARCWGRCAPEKRAAVGPVFEMMADWMVVQDPPAHTRLRKLATVAFHPKKFVAMEGRIRELVDRYIDDYVASGQADLIANFSFPLPATIICELIGAPVSDAEKIKEWSEDLVAGRVRRRRRGARRAPRAGDARAGGDAGLLRGPARAGAGEPHGRRHDLEHAARATAPASSSPTTR